MKEILDIHLTNQTPIHTAASLNDSLATPSKQPDEPIVNQIATQVMCNKMPPYNPVMPTPNMQSTQIQLYQNMPSIEQSPLAQNTLNPLNLTNDAYAPFFHSQSIANCYYTPIKTETANMAYPLAYTAGAECGYSSNATVPQCAVAYVPTDMTITAAMPTTIMSAQMQPSSVLKPDELAALDCQLTHGLKNVKPKRLGSRHKRNRFKTALFDDLEPPKDDDVADQVRWSFSWVL